MPRPNPAVSEAARLLEAASNHLSTKDPFRAEALSRLADCAQELATSKSLYLVLPRGKVTMWEADGGRHYMPQTAAMTSGIVKVEPK